MRSLALAAKALSQPLVAPEAVPIFVDYLSASRCPNLFCIATLELTAIELEILQPLIGYNGSVDVSAVRSSIHGMEAFSAWRLANLGLASRSALKKKNRLTIRRHAAASRKPWSRRLWARTPIASRFDPAVRSRPDPIHSSRPPRFSFFQIFTDSLVESISAHRNAFEGLRPCGAEAA